MIHNDPKLTLVWANVSRLTPLKLISCTNVPKDPGFVSPEPRRLSVADLIRVLADFRISTNLEIFSLIISLNQSAFDIQHLVSPGISYRLSLPVFHRQHLLTTCYHFCFYGSVQQKNIMLVSFPENLIIKETLPGKYCVVFYGFWYRLEWWKIYQNIWLFSPLS